MDDCKLIPVYRHGELYAYAIVDTEDYERASAYSWTFRTGRYACAKINGAVVFMHHFISETSGQELTDHRNGIGLDNRKSNLRPCTPKENMWNRKANGTYRGRARTSQYKGVWREAGKQLKWRAAIVVDGRKTHLGRFDTELEAATAYDAAARFHFGDFACTNLEGDLSLSVDDLRVGIEPRQKTSTYRGVWREQGKWRAAITVNGKRLKLGRFEREIDAAKAHDEAARQHHGIAARLNFPE